MLPYFIHVHSPNVEMALVSFPTIIYSSRFISHSPHSLPYISLPSKLQNLPLRKPEKKAYVLSISHSPISHEALIYSSFSLRHTRLALVPINAKNSGSGEEDHSDSKHSGSREEDHLDAKHSGSREEDHRALETVNKFYAAIKNKNINQLSDIIGDECRCICNFSSFFQSYEGKMVYALQPRKHTWIVLFFMHAQCHFNCSNTLQHYGTHDQTNIYGVSFFAASVGFSL